jgi:hypothetical protein
MDSADFQEESLKETKAALAAAQNARGMWAAFLESTPTNSALVIPSLATLPC